MKNRKNRYRKNKQRFYSLGLAKFEKAIGVTLFFVSFGVIPIKGLGWGIITMAVGGVIFFHAGAREYNYQREGGNIIYNG